MRYAVGYVDFDDGELEVRIIKAENWRNALQDAFGMARHLPSGDDLELGKRYAYNQGWEFDVVEIPELDKSDPFPC